MNITKTIISLTILATLIVSISACGGVNKMISISSMVKKETSELKKMSIEDVNTLVSEDIDLRRIEYDPDGILGQYIRVSGKVNLSGYDNFKFDLNENSPDKPLHSFILEDLIFVITLSEYPQISNGDKVEIIGLVSSSRFIKAMRELYPDENIPDLLTVIAKDVQLIEPEADKISD